jgi:hypothetical protein
MVCFVDSLLHVFAVLLITTLYHVAWLRRVVLLLPNTLPWSKRLQLIAMYCQVPVVRRSVHQFGVSVVFPQMINEISFGSLKTSALGMQLGVVRAPFVFVPSLPFDVEKVRLPEGVKRLQASWTSVRDELNDLLEKKQQFDVFFGSWETFDFWLYGERKALHSEQCPRTVALLQQVF